MTAADINAAPNSYVLQLDFFRFKNLLDLELPDGSVYVRAQCEPFNPEMTLSEKRMINWLKKCNLNECNDYEPFQIHASGHASGKELQDFIDQVKPKKLIPVHTLKPKLFRNTHGSVEIPTLKTKINL